MAVHTATPDFSCSATLRLELGSSARALTAMRSLEVDLELDPSTVRKQFHLDEGSGGDASTLRVEFEATTERMLRVALSSFFDMSKVVIETMDEFEPISADATG